MPEGQRHLTHTGRSRIHALMKSGLSNAAIARQLGRSPSSVPRGIRRNGGARGQRRAQAQRRAEARRGAAPSVPSSHAATSRTIVPRAGIRRSRHCRERTLVPVPAMSGQDPCFGVWWTMRRSASRDASAGSKAS